MSDELPERALRRLLDDGRELLEEEGSLLAGRYRLIRELGRGGMGVVWEAADLELERRVAIKLLAPALVADEQAQQRFLREARAAAGLTHPNLAAVYEADERMLVMQLVDGVTLAEAPRDDRRRSVSLLRDAALAVHHAHSRGIVHRDLKPANLMVEGDRVVVTDFGLAKQVEIDSSLSHSGAVLGTPSTMAPEQVQGRLHDIDARTDVYGLGATLYELLTDQPPFAGTEVVALFRAIVEDEPSSLRKLRPDIPKDLDTVVRKCLAKERERRYQSARDLADDLTRWLEGQPVLAQPPSWIYRTSKFVARRRAAVVTASVAAVVITVVGVGMWVERRAVTREANAATAALQLAETVRTILESGRELSREGFIDEARTIYDEGIAQCRRFLLDVPLPQVEAMLGRLLSHRGQRREALTLLDRALDQQPDLHLARFERGLVRAASFSDSLLQLDPAPHADEVDQLPAELAELRAGALEDLEIIDHSDLRLRQIDRVFAAAERSWLTGDRDSARRGYDRALELDGADQRARLAKSRMTLEEGDAEAAWHLAMSAVDLYSGFGAAFRDTDPASAAKDAALGSLLSRTATRLHVDEIDGALADFDQAVRESPTNALARGNRGIVLARRALALVSEGRWADSIPVWDQAIADYDLALSLNGSLAGAWNNRGFCEAAKEQVYRALGRDAEAQAALSVAIDNFGSAIAGSPRFALAYLNRGLVRLRMGQTDAGNDDLRQALGLTLDGEARQRYQDTIDAAARRREASKLPR